MKIRLRKNGRAALPALCVLVLTGLGLGIPAVASADESAGGLQFIMVSDDLRKTTTDTERPDGATPAAPASPSAAGDGSGKSNNGHGNNADGVDSSNPGQGGGGPNGAVDLSGDVDDEVGGGAASPSKGKGKK